MERRDFLKIAAGFAASLAALGKSVEAAPLPPGSVAGEDGAASSAIARPAVTSSDEVDSLNPIEVRGGHGGHGHRGGRGRHRGWHHRHRHRGWHHRHGGWRPHHRHRRRRHW